MFEDDPLAEHDNYRGISELEVGESWEIGDGYSVKRVS